MTSKKRNHVEIELDTKSTLTSAEGIQSIVQDPTKGLLSKLFDNVTTLVSLLPDNISEQDDSIEFRTFLESTLVGSNESIKLILEPDGSEITMKEVMGRIQGRLFNLHAKSLSKNKPEPGIYLNHTPPNILTLGYRRADERMSVHNAGAAGIAFYAHSVNTIITQINSSPEWQTLLNRIGAGPLFTLFATPTNALFTSLPNDCYLQISGKPLCDMKPKVANSTTRRRRKKIPNTKIPPPEVVTTLSEPPIRKKRKRNRKHSRKNLVTTDEESDSEVEEVEESILVELPPPPLKKPRLRPSLSAPQLETRSSLIRLPLRPTQSVALLLGKRKSEEKEEVVAANKKVKVEKEIDRSPNEVAFARNQMYHARPTKSVTGRVLYGLSSKHVLSRLSKLYPPLTPEANECFDPIGFQSRHLLKHIFPMQFGLHNVFEVVKSQWAPKVDYEDREAEIKKLGSIKTPQRLKALMPLMEKLIKFHSKCKFRKILDRHCPSRITHEKLSESDKSAILELMTEDGEVSMQARTQLSKADVSIALSSHPSQVVQHGASQAAAKFREKPKFTEYLTTPYEVEGYVIAVIHEIIPRDFWGSESNSKLIIGHVKEFLRLRRYETISVHTLLQKFCVADCDWLRPSTASKKSNFNQMPNQVEMGKRRELLQEFLYWFIDSFVMNIVKTAFSVTESAAYRNRTLYFRQDDWNAICRPILDTFGHTIFKQIPREYVEEILKNRTLGFSYVRLLPKETGVRPIVNLRRRAMITGPRGLPELGRSINNQLENTFHTLTFEKNRHPELLGSSVMGPGEIYSKLKQFKAGLNLNGTSLPKLYLVKVDVRNCFDTIKQEKLLEIIEKIILEEDYRIQKYSHTIPAAGRVTKKFSRSAYPEEEHSTFPDLATRLSATLRHAIFTDNVVYPKENRELMIALLREHITGNIVKIGDGFFRQVDGIPQGSVLSGLLCSLFYGHMEKHCLQFTKDPSATLFRYIDDFLFITTKKPLATKFLKVMDAGLPEYGCFVSAEKCLTNFDISLDGAVTLPALSTNDFPWCGYVINSDTLELKADTTRYQDIEISDTLTVERHKKPGQAFVYKMLQSIKLRAHIIYNDTSHNSARTVYLNIYQNFLLTALKFHSYIHEWGAEPSQRPSFFLDVIEQIVQFAYVTIRNRANTKTAREVGAVSDIRRKTVVWLGRQAFHRILKKKPTLYSAINKKLSKQIGGTENDLIRRKMSKIVLAPSNSFIERSSWQKRR